MITKILFPLYCGAIWVLDVKNSYSKMSILQQILPVKLRWYLRVLLWRGRDFFGNQRFAALLNPDMQMMAVVTIQQPVLTTASSANKIHNISLALKKLNGLVIAPGETFSFCRLVGNPSQKRGYQKSRSIVGGQLVAETGGGLCQLSGLIYFLAIKAGLEITERHAHSMDIYTEEERFTPLGSDATVAYGYKDMRFTNNLPHPVGLQFVLTAAELTGSITSSLPVQVAAITFNYTTEGGMVRAVTLCDSQIICTNTYKRLAPGS
jgi:vancomycin resistance protein VanW